MLDPMTTSRGAAASSSASSLIFRSRTSGADSWTNPAPSTASARLPANRSRDSDAPGRRPSFSSTGQACRTDSASRSAAPSPGSQAATSNPIRRKCAAQPAPMTPVPTTATVPTDSGGA